MIKNEKKLPVAHGSAREIWGFCNSLEIPFRGWFLKDVFLVAFKGNLKSYNIAKDIIRWWCRPSLPIKISAYLWYPPCRADKLSTQLRKGVPDYAQHT
jgi:hypothetical protein